MTMSDRGVHPDLLDEVQAEREAAPQETQPVEGRSRRRGPVARQNGTPPPADDSPPGASAGPEEGETAGLVVSPESGEAQTLDWRQAQSDEEAFKLLAKRLPPDALRQDETLAGLIGATADMRARQLIREQEREANERQKREAAANNDLYTLGELAQRELQQQAAANAGADRLAPLMDAITRFQQTLPETVQKEVAGKTFGEGKPWHEGAVEYMAQLVESATNHRLREREAALRKSILSEINGNEPVPEREGGTPSRVRVVTDEQVAAMSLAEYEGLFDENGHPRPGVRHQATRGIPIQRQ